MKATFLFTRMLVAGLLLAGLLSTIPAMAQERPDCETCECHGTLFAGYCKITCCKPLVPSCDCYIWGCRLSCSLSSIEIPSIHEQNIRDFANYLHTAVFTSPAAMNLAKDIPLYLQAHASGSVETFYAIMERLETNTRQLSTAEKQYANQWIAARGGSPNTIP